MRDAYRNARAIVAQLSPCGIADRDIRLKSRIGGDFYVIEADEEKIVLGVPVVQFYEDDPQPACGRRNITSFSWWANATRSRSTGLAILPIGVLGRSVVM